jgi:hypothetical protein
MSDVIGKVLGGLSPFATVHRCQVPPNQVLVALSVGRLRCNKCGESNRRKTGDGCDERFRVHTILQVDVRRCALDVDLDTTRLIRVVRDPFLFGLAASP